MIRLLHVAKPFSSFFFGQVPAKQLGFAFKDISEHLPGAFIIYRADKEDDELFYANDEFFHMAGYKDIDELIQIY